MQSRLIHWSAGTRDSALTNHGNLQAERLGHYFAQTGLRFTHIFSSDLQRAYQTAVAIQSAQSSLQNSGKFEGLEIQKLPLLREQDFGSFEGKPFHARLGGSNLSGKDIYRSRQISNPVFKDVESKESMVQRMDGFVQDYLSPLLYTETSELNPIVCIISHGIILSYLWRCLLKIFPRQSVILASGTVTANRGFVLLEHLGGWSNTGYLELDIHKSSAKLETSFAEPRMWLSGPKHLSTVTGRVPTMSHLKMTIKTVNGQDHLRSLKRTRGGLGSSKYDEGQKKIESFFKKTTVG